MKTIRGKRLTLKEKKRVKQQGYDPKEVLRKKDIFINRNTGKEVIVN